MENRNMQEFDLNGALDRLAARVCREIKSKHRRERAIKEFRGHLEDAAEDIMRQGKPPEVAYAELEESLGDTDKLSTLMASVHNTHHIPVILPWMAGAAVLGGLIYLYLTTENDSLQSWIGVGLQLFAIAAGIALVLFAAKWIRAIGKRASALRRLQKYVDANGGTLIRRGNCYKSLFVRTAYPELTVDMGDRRYILSFWATVKRRRTLHLQDNGIYSYDKHFGYMLATPASQAAIIFRSSLFRPKGMEWDPLFTWYHSEMTKLPGSGHLMPEIDYGALYAPDKVNIPVFLLNPIPLDVEICENDHIHKLADGDKLPDSLGGATVYSMSSFVSAVDRAVVSDHTETNSTLLQENQDPIKVSKRRVQTPKAFRSIGGMVTIRKKIRQRLLLRWAFMLLLGTAFGAFLILSESMFRNSPSEYRLNQAVTILLYLFIFWRSRVLSLTFSKEWVGVIRDERVVSYTRNQQGLIRFVKPSCGVDALKCIWTVETDNGKTKEIAADTEEIREGYFKVGERIRLYKTAKIPVKAHPPVGGEDLMCPLCGMTVDRPVCTKCGADFTEDEF